MCRIYKIDPGNLEAEKVENLYLAYKDIVKKYSLLDSYRCIDNYKTLFLSTFIGNDNEVFILEKDSLICGIFSCTRLTDSNVKKCKLNISLAVPAIDEVILKSINQFIQNKLETNEEVAVVTYNNEIEKVIDRYTYKTASRGNHYTLKKEDINIDMLDKAIKEYETKNNDLYIKYTDNISEEYINQYCDLFTETMKDMTDVMDDGYIQYVITPEKQRQINDSFNKRNITHHCYMIFNLDNKMVAKSNVWVKNDDPRFPYQFMIGVKRAYRGRSLGKWLYASMYKRLFENVAFEKVHVSHHPENKHAINISEWVGYKFNYLETEHVLYK